MKGNLLQQLFNYHVTNFGYLWDLFFKHLLMSVHGVLFAALIGIPLGILPVRYAKLSEFVIIIANIIRTVPAIATLAILILVTSLGSETVVLAVSLCVLLPIIKNTYTGITSADADIKDAGKGMGMARNQVLRMIELPLSVSVTISGIRIVSVVAIGVVAVGSFIGAPTLDDIVARGINVTDGTTFVLAGAIPVAIIVIAVDVLLRFLEKRLNPTTRHHKDQFNHRPQSINM